MPLTSAPAEKNRPSPVRTVKTVSGCSFRTRSAAMTSGMRFPPKEQLKGNDGKSMMEMKRLQNAPIRDARVIAVVNAVDALAERFVEGAPAERFRVKREEMEQKSKARSKI